MGRRVAVGMTTVVMMVWAGGASAATISLDKFEKPTGFGSQAVHPCPLRGGDGPIQLAWPGAGKRAKGTCQNAVMVGTWKAWHRNGEVHWKGTFDAGRVVGKWKAWHTTGKKAVVAKYDAGFAHGDFKAWWSNGEKRAVGAYHKSEASGCWKTWYKDGNKKSKGTWSNRKRVLTWLRWSQQGKRSKEKLGGTAAHGRIDS
jgi:hypothetical protein